MTYVYHFYISWCLLARPNRRGTFRSADFHLMAFNPDWHRHFAAGEMSVAVTYMSSSGDLNTRRQERRINILSASNRSSKSRPALSSADLLHGNLFQQIFSLCTTFNNICLNIYLYICAKFGESNCEWLTTVFPFLASVDGSAKRDLFLASVDGSAKTSEIIGRQYNIVQDMVAIFGKHDIVNFLYLYDFSRISDTDSWISQIQVWVLLKCVKLFFSVSIIHSFLSNMN